jgi:hypothetical protein
VGEVDVGVKDVVEVEVRDGSVVVVTVVVVKVTGSVVVTGLLQAVRAVDSTKTKKIPL